jgi:putative tryptophan/tyrosine transport system substrate-binding protein
VATVNADSLEPDRPALAVDQNINPGVSVPVEPAIDATVPPRNKKKLILILVAALIVIVGAITSYLLINGNKKEDSKKVLHIGILSGVENFAPTVDNFKTEMTNLGYTENQNVIYDVRRLNDEPAKAKEYSEEFVKNKVDLIFAFPTEAAQAAKTAASGTNIPVVFAWSTMEGTGLIESIPRPGGNITGIRMSSADLLAKTFDILLEIKPQLKRVQIIYDLKIPAATDSMVLIRQAAQVAGVALVETTNINTIDELKADLQARSAAADIGFDASMLLPNATTISPEGVTIMAEFTQNHKIPLAGLSSEQVGLGVLFGFGPTVPSTSKLAAIQVDKVLKGASAGELPVVTVDGSLWVDAKVAAAIGLEIPEGVLSRADRVIH